SIIHLNSMEIYLCQPKNSSFAISTSGRKRSALPRTHFATAWNRTATTASSAILGRLRFPSAWNRKPPRPSSRSCSTERRARHVYFPSERHDPPWRLRGGDADAPLGERRLHPHRSAIPGALPKP